MRYAVIYLAEPESEPNNRQWTIIDQADNCNEAFEYACAENPNWMKMPGSRIYFYSGKGRPLVVLEKRDSKIQQIYPDLTDFPKISDDILSTLQKQS